MCDQEVQSHAFAAKTSNVYCTVVVEVDVKGGDPLFMTKPDINLQITVLQFEFNSRHSS